MGTRPGRDKGLERIQELRSLGIEPFSPRCRRTHALSALSQGSLKEGEWVVFCGRILERREGSEEIEILLADESGREEIIIPKGESPSPAMRGMGDARAPAGKPGFDPGKYWPLCRKGDIVEAEGVIREGRFRIQQGRLLSAAVEAGDWRLWQEKVKERLRIRWKVIQGIREFFLSRGFIEVDTPILLEAPGMESHLSNFETLFHGPDGSSRKLYLPTSPEYAMKALLVSGFERIFQLCHSFRNGEHSLLHSPEFAMLEWYRAYASSEEIMKDTEDLVRTLAKQVTGKERILYQGKTVDLSPPWERITVKEAMERHAGIRLDEVSSPEDFRALLVQKGYREFSPELDWNTLFFMPFLKEVEPKLGRGKPAILVDYPPSMCLLARMKEGEDAADRFEVYIEGLELANAFTELCDPVEHRRRLAEQQKERIAQGREVLPVDEAFLRCIERGLPPSGGIALGVDRLVMLLTGSRELSEVLPFPLNL